jgi:hypothetical protein
LELLGLKNPQIRENWASIVVALRSDRHKLKLAFVYLSGLVDGSVGAEVLIGLEMDARKAIAQ